MTGVRLLNSLASILAVVAASVSLGCSSGEDERMPIGPPPTAAEYCVGLGYTLTASDCNLPGGVVCEEFAFFRGECGQSSSYCNTHGGTIATVIADLGTFTTISGVCTLPGGVMCDEGSYFKTGKCP